MKQPGSLEQGVFGEKVSQPRGREAIPLEASIEVQLHLMYLMLPERIKPYVTPSDGEHVNMEDQLFDLWANKYAAHFSDFCDEFADDNELIEHIQSKQLNNEETERIASYLQHVSGGKAFFTENELQDFMRMNIH